MCFAENRCAAVIQQKTKLNLRIDPNVGEISDQMSADEINLTDADLPIFSHGP